MLRAVHKDRHFNCCFVLTFWLLTLFLPSGISFAPSCHPASFQLNNQRIPKYQQRRSAQQTFLKGNTSSNKDDIWASQRQLVEDLKQSNEKSLQEEMREKFAQRRSALVNDTLFLGFFIFCALWTFSENPFVPLSYSLGAFFGTLYAYGLGKYVETLNLGTGPQDIESLVNEQGAGVGQARFAFFIMLFIFIGKFRSYGLLEIPSILGFFTYQLASLSQGLQEFDE